MAYKLTANNTTNHPLTIPQRQPMQHKTNKPTHKKQTNPQKQTSKDKAAQFNWPVLACVPSVFTP
jgi:hypothetical protein